MNKQPLVSIGIPTRNRIRYLQEAIESALNQSYFNIEIIVSNNESSDKTREYLDSIKDNRIKVFHQNKMLEMVENWNFCLDNAKGEFFLLLSDDDILEKNCIEILLDLYLQNPKVAFSYGAVKIIENRKSFNAPFPNRNKIKSAESMIVSFFDSFLSTYACCILFRKTHIRYNKNLRYLFDAYFWIENLIYFKNQPFWTEKNVSRYRKHHNSETKKSKKIDWIKDDLKILEFLISHKFLDDEVRKKLMQCKSEYTFLYKIANEEKGVMRFLKSMILYKPRLHKILTGLKLIN
jgi:glycosyltransferase involved in cell wall biosynthesis